jgi:predicted alpha-1,6-mannanase (GH76 family)
VLDGVERTDGARYRGLIRTLYEGRDQRGWIVDYFDDENWMTMALMRAYDLTGDELYLNRTENIFQDIMGAWDTTCCGEHLGGIWWNREMTQKATASNAGPVIAGARLAARTGDDQYLDFASMAYDFWMDHMVDQETFAIFDHFEPPEGERFPGALTYNHGLMIGAALELHAATGEAHYLSEAHGFGQYMSMVATRASSVGPLLHDDIGGDCDGDCPAWKGIGYRYLALLFRQDPSNQIYEEVLTAGAEGLWTLARSESDLFSTNWAGPPPTAGGVEEQGSAAMALNLYAILCGSDASTTALDSRVEAEESWLDSVGLEADHAGYSGFGYVAGFAADGQAVTFEWDAPEAGTYRVDWHYAAAGGAAQRSLVVNGGSASPLSFAGTATWDAWASVSSDLELLQGRNSIELRFDTGSGSAGPLTLDRIELARQ